MKITFSGICGIWCTCIYNKKPFFKWGRVYCGCSWGLLCIIGNIYYLLTGDRWSRPDHGTCEAGLAEPCRERCVFWGTDSSQLPQCLQVRLSLITCIVYFKIINTCFYARLIFVKLVVFLVWKIENIWYNMLFASNKWTEE